MNRLEAETTSRSADGALITFVTVSGEVDLANSDQFEAALDPDRFADADGVVLDLRLVPFMDSSGLAAVLGASEDLGPRLSVLLAPESDVQRLFEMTSTLDRAAITFSEDEAIASLASERDGS